MMRARCMAFCCSSASVLRPVYTFCCSSASVLRPVYTFHTRHTSLTVHSAQRLTHLHDERPWHALHQEDRSTKVGHKGHKGINQLRSCGHLSTGRQVSSSVVFIIVIVVVFSVLLMMMTLRVDDVACCRW